MVLRTAPDLPGTFYAQVARLGADGRGRTVAYLALLTPGEGLTEDAVLEIAHKFILSGARLADRSGKVLGEVVESGIAPPGGVNWHGLQVPEGTWHVAVRLRGEEIEHDLKSTRRVVLHPVTEATKWGEGDVDRQTLEAVLRAALRPVVEAMGNVEVRLKHLEQRVRADPFGDAVRGRGDAGTRELQRLKRQQQATDPVGAAIAERRPPLLSYHPTLDALGRARTPNEAPPPPDPVDPFGAEVTRKRPPLRRPVGVAAAPKR